MKETIARAAALLFALMLTLAYFFLPVAEENKTLSNGGMKKQELTLGETYSWSWSPETDSVTDVELTLSGIKKAAGVTVYAELLDENGSLVSSVEQAVAELGADRESIRLSGSFSRGRIYTLRVRASGEGTLKLKGEISEDTEEFVPLLTEYATAEKRNAVLLYFAAGALLAALTPVFGRTEPKKNLKNEKKTPISRALPWMTFALLAGLGIWITLVKPMPVEGKAWSTWDEEIHWAHVLDMSLFGTGGLRILAGSMITWNPGYLPLAVGYNLGKIFTSSEPVLYHISVLCNALTYAALCSLAVKHAPRYKATFLVAGTLPTFVFMMTGVTYDPVVAGTILLGTALVLETMDRKEKISPVRAITMVSLLAFGTVAKPAYSLALLSLLMIPSPCFGGKGKAWVFRLFVFLMTAWCFASMLMPGAYDAVREGDARFAGTSVSGQLEYMLANPAEGGLEPVRYVWRSRDFLTRAGISHWAYLGNNDLMNRIYFWMLLIAAPLCTAGELWDRKSVLSPGRRIAFGLTAIGAEIVLAYAQYLASSEVGGSMSGLQARYFMPVWCLMALALMWPQAVRKRLGPVGEWMTLAVYLVCLGGNLQNLIMHLTEQGML